MTDPAEVQPNALGGRIAGKIASTVVDATVATKQRLASHTAGVANQVLTDFTNHVSDEIRAVLGPLWRRIATAEDTPDEVRPLFHELGHSQGQAWAWIGGAITSQGISAGLSGLFAAYFAAVNWEANRTLRPALLSPTDAAHAEVIGRTAGINMEGELARNGLSDARQQVLLALAHNRMPADVVLELWRRGHIAQRDAADLLRLAGYESGDIEKLLQLREIPLSPPDAAAAWARSELTPEQTDAIGAKSGVSKEDMRIQRALAGMPPSPEELLFAWRRGIIKESDVDRGIIQGPIRNEWIPVIKALQWLPLSPEEAANAVNQGHLSLDVARNRAKETGVRPEDFDVIVANAGIPPGPQEALDWVNRGILSEDDFRIAFLESRIKNKYIDLYLQSRHTIMPPETIRLMYSRGAMSKEDALHRLQQRGYTAEDAAIIIDGASAEKTAGSRDLTVSQVLSLRAEGLISNDDALAMLQAAGYDEEEAVWVTQLADLRRVARFVTAAVNRTKASYIAGRLSETDAGTVIDRLGLPSEFKDEAFALWDLERTTITKGLTVAQITAAIKKGFMSAEDGLARLVGQGYAEDDARILLLSAGAITP